MERLIDITQMRKELGIFCPKWDDVKTRVEAFGLELQMQNTESSLKAGKWCSFIYALGDMEVQLLKYCNKKLLLDYGVSPQGFDKFEKVYQKEDFPDGEYIGDAMEEGLSFFVQRQQTQKESQQPVVSRPVSWSGVPVKNSNANFSLNGRLDSLQRKSFIFFIFF